MKQRDYKPMDCPVCHMFRFSELQKYDDPDDFYCMSCGWNYDLNQTENPALKNGANEMSLNEYKEWYNNKINENPNYEYYIENMPKPVPHNCPVCGKYEFEDDSSFDICPFCGWEDDGLQLIKPNFAGGANDLSLNQYKKQYKELIKKDPNYKWSK